MRYAIVRIGVLFMALAWLGPAAAALAHRVNVFAYVEGDTVQVECSYSKSDRVRFGDIEVRDAASGKVYLTGKTDEKGNFAFPVPAEARAAKSDLVVLLRAGEGHQNECTVKAEEYLSAAPAPPADPAPAAAAVAPAQAGATPVVVAAAPVPPVDTAALQAAIQAAVEAGLEKKNRAHPQDARGGKGEGAGPDRDHGRHRLPARHCRPAGLCPIPSGAAPPVIDEPLARGTTLVHALDPRGKLAACLGLSLAAALAATPGTAPGRAGGRTGPDRPVASGRGAS